MTSFLFINIKKSFKIFRESIHVDKQKFLIYTCRATMFIQFYNQIGF